ncbi:MAG: LppP/LprE family lipoprotein [Nodosilinea sp.]
MKHPLSLLPGVLVLAASLVGPMAMAQADPGGAWLDESTPWNTAAAAIPSAPTPEGGGNLASCEDSFRAATLPEDALVEAAGWTLVGSAQVYGPTTLITGMSDADGMCRPLGYQVFVFSNGAFVGTLSPVVMNSRTDGSLISADLYSPTNLTATFNRYTPEDALCCASASSLVFYQIEDQVVVPTLPADTTPATQPEVN